MEDKWRKSPSSPPPCTHGYQAPGSGPGILCWSSQSSWAEQEDKHETHLSITKSYEDIHMTRREPTLELRAGYNGTLRQVGSSSCYWAAFSSSALLVTVGYWRGTPPGLLFPRRGISPRATLPVSPQLLLILLHAEKVGLLLLLNLGEGQRTVTPGLFLQKVCFWANREDGGGGLCGSGRGRGMYGRVNVSCHGSQNQAHHQHDDNEHFSYIKSLKVWHCSFLRGLPIPEQPVFVSIHVQFGHEGHCLWVVLTSECLMILCN